MVGRNFQTNTRLRTRLRNSVRACAVRGRCGVGALLATLLDNNTGDLAISSSHRNRNRGNAIRTSEDSITTNGTNLCQLDNISNVDRAASIRRTGLDRNISVSKLASRVLAVSLGSLRLGRNNNLTSGSNNLFVVCLVNVASQSRNQQSGQDGQDDQDDDQLDEG